MCKTGWKGTNKCEFCDANECIDHLFFTCSFARFLWNVVGSALGNPQTPLSFFDFCQNWLPKYTGKDRMVIAIGTTALLWSVWKVRNKPCFQSSLPKDPTDIIFSLCSVLDSWGVLQKRGVQKTLKGSDQEVGPDSEGRLQACLRLGPYCTEALLIKC